jgi:hypothetical protein
MHSYVIHFMLVLLTTFAEIKPVPLIAEQYLKYLTSDNVFDALYPVHLQHLSALHWSPLAAAVIAARFLAPDDNASVIDIGAGAGKFCIAGAMATGGRFTGIEQKKNLVAVANKIISQLAIPNTEIMHGNFIDFDISGYNAVYFFNSFYENLAIGTSAAATQDEQHLLYEHYTTHLLTQLAAMPAGTRLATYWLNAGEVPGCYRLIESHCSGRLKLWVRQG